MDGEIVVVVGIGVVGIIVNDIKVFEKLIEWGICVDFMVLVDFE